MGTDALKLQIVVIGMGSFGSALASVCAANGHAVTLIGRNDELAATINRNHMNPRYLPDTVLHSNIVATTDLSTVTSADAVLLAVPTHAMRLVCRELNGNLPRNATIIHVAKGLEVETDLRMSQVILQECADLGEPQLAVVSGPSHAEEVSRRLPTTLAVASASKNTAEFVQDILMNHALRVYTNPDVIGTELGGALKNIIALGCGISDGLSFGDNARAAIMTRGLVEITRLGVKMGAAYSTFSGLTGVGDLIVTCTSKHSRNWTAGYLLGSGLTLDAALDRIGMAVEGVRTTRAALDLAAKQGVSLPIASEIADVLFHLKPPREAVSDLMQRMRTHEMEEYVQDTTASWQFP